jgi:ketosteroid isomerase-like protein
MVRMKPALLVCALIAAGCATRPARDPLEPATSLAAAETAFAAQSVREDSRAAFLAHFADDGVLVRDGWTLAHPALEAQAAPAILLTWRPVYVEAAQAGDLGISTGPWTLTPRDAARPTRHGQFVSVWRRSQGRWQVIADIGTVHDSPALADAKLEMHVASATDGDAASLAQAERAFAQEAARSGLRAAIRDHGSQSLRVYREGQAPWLGAALSLPLAAGDENPITYTVQDVQVSRSGDLGFARGTYTWRADAGHGVWLRAWRRENGAWRVALAVANASAHEHASH